MVKEKLTDIELRLRGLLDRMGNGKESIDMGRMKSVVHRRVLEAMSAVSVGLCHYMYLHNS